MSIVSLSSQYKSEDLIGAFHEKLAKLNGLYAGTFNFKIYQPLDGDIEKQLQLILEGISIVKINDHLSNFSAFGSFVEKIDPKNKVAIGFRYTDNRVTVFCRNKAIDMAYYTEPSESKIEKFKETRIIKIAGTIFTQALSAYECFKMTRKKIIAELVVAMPMDLVQMIASFLESNPDLERKIGWNQEHLPANFSI